jgi:hypothetical protein
LAHAPQNPMINALETCLVWSTGWLQLAVALLLK